MKSNFTQRINRTLSYFLIFFVCILNISPIFNLESLITRAKADSNDYTMSKDLNLVINQSNNILDANLYLKNDLTNKYSQITKSSYEIFHGDGSTTNNFGSFPYDDNYYSLFKQINLSGFADDEYYIEGYVEVNGQKIRQRAYFAVGTNPSYSTQASNSWSKYASNPIVSDTSINQARVVKSGSTYNIWLKNNSGNLVYYSTTDLTNWGSMTVCTESGVGSLANINEPTIILDGSTYKMWYESTTSTGTIKYRTSSDGKVWTSESSLTWSDGDNTWEDNGRYSPWVIKDGATYKMWYQSFSNTSGETGDRRINYATSIDGIAFDNAGNLGQVTFDGSTNNNIVLSVGASGAWDDNSIFSVNVVKHPETNYFELWYGAENGDSVYKIGHSISADGIRWTKDSNNPVLSVGASGAWDDAGVYLPTVLINDTGTAGDIYEMFYTGYDGSDTRIGYATISSTDLTNIIQQEFVYDSATGTFQTVTLNTIGYTDVSSGSVNEDLIKGTEYAASAYTRDITQNYKYWDTGSSAWVNSKSLGTYPIQRRVAQASYTQATIIRKDNLTTTNDNGIDKVISYQQETNVTLSNGWKVNITQNYDSFTNSVEIIDPDDGLSVYLTGDPRLIQAAGTITQNLTNLGNYLFDLGGYTLTAKAMKTASGYSYITDLSITNTSDFKFQLGRDGEVKVSGGTGSGFEDYPSLNYRIAPHNGSTLISNNITVEVESGRSLSSATLNWGGTSYSMTAVSGTNNYVWTASVAPQNGNYTYYVTDNESTNPQQTANKTITVSVPTSPRIASVLTPVNDAYYNSSNIPTNFTGYAADGTSGTGLDANSTTFYIKRASDNKYWTGTTWSVTETWLATTHSATTDSASVAWTSNITLPTWVSEETYTTAAKVTNKVANTLTGDITTYYYDTSTPVTPTVYDGSRSGIETSEVESLTTLSANWNLSANPFSGISKYEYAIGTTSGGTDVISWTNNGTNSSMTHNGLNLTLGQKYYVSVRITNKAGTTSLVGISSGQTVVDATGPEISLTSKPSDPTNNKTPRFIGKANDVMSDVTKIEYKIDNNDWNTIWSGSGSKEKSFDFTTTTLTDGGHSIYIRAIDAKNNIGSESKTSFTVDTVAPNAPNIDTPKSGEVVLTNKPTISGSAEPNSKIKITLNSTITHNYQISVNGLGQWAYTVPDELEEGSHSLEAKNEDTAGNISSASSVSFTIKTASSPVTAGSTINQFSGQTIANSIIENTKSEKNNALISLIVDGINLIKDSSKTTNTISSLPNKNIVLSIKPSSSKEVKSITTLFDGNSIEFSKTDTNIYQAQLLTPSVDGNYKAKATVLYTDGSTEEINIEILVDPYGYVYELNKKGEQRLTDVKLTLYVNNNGQWEIWDGSKYNQNNPQTTTDNGEYGFMVPAGTYYVVASKDGYFEYRSEEITVKEGKPVNVNIQMQQKNNNLWIYGLIALLIVAGVGTYFSLLRKKESKEIV